MDEAVLYATPLKTLCNPTEGQSSMSSAGTVTPLILPTQVPGKVPIARWKLQQAAPNQTTPVQTTRQTLGGYSGTALTCSTLNFTYLLRLSLYLCISFHILCAIDPILCTCSLSRLHKKGDNKKLILWRGAFFSSSISESTLSWQQFLIQHVINI